MGQWAYIQFVDKPGGRPDHELPGFPGAPGHPGHLPARPSRPVDPGYGIEEGGDETAEQLPVWPLDPEHPDTGLPPVPGQPLPPSDPPPGTIWPPLPPGIPEGKAIVLVAISGVGYRYVVVDIPPGSPDQGLPGEGEPDGPEVQPPRPGVGPGRPGQGLPQPPQRPQPPARPGQGLPGQGRPPTAGQPLPRPPGVRPQPR